MKRARTILIIIALAAMTAGMTAFSFRRGINNLYLTTSAQFTLGGASRWITYAATCPYRNFATSPTQPTVNANRPLYSSVTLTWVTIGGIPFTYTVATGMAWPSTLVYDDEDQ